MPDSYWYGYLQDGVFHLAANGTSTVLIDNLGKVTNMSGPPIAAVSDPVLNLMSSAGVEVSSVEPSQVSISVGDEVPDFSSYWFIE